MCHTKKPKTYLLVTIWIIWISLITLNLVISWTFCIWMIFPARTTFQVLNSASHVIKIFPEYFIKLRSVKKFSIVYIIYNEYEIVQIFFMKRNGSQLRKKGKHYILCHMEIIQHQEIFLNRKFWCFYVVQY